MRCGRAYTGPMDRTVMCFMPSPRGGVPCGGRIAWRGNPDDWMLCPDCEGSGSDPRDACARCHGDGWLMGRA